ncbi:G-protein gamma-like domain [Sesbania bispinosa]|nr:G-protein gamma-like domain [Sesbania bispinosa]
MDGANSMEKLMSPKSPLPGLVDFHGKRKQMVKIQVLEREIGMLQEELKSLEGLQPASRCCKELDAFVGSISDPFTPTRKQTVTESHHFKKQIRKWQKVVVAAVHHQTVNVLAGAA